MQNGFIEDVVTMNRPLFRLVQDGFVEAAVTINERTSADYLDWCKMVPHTDPSLAASVSWT